MALTKYPSGSMRELSAVALPLMLSSLSAMAMLFVDRLLLAHHSLQALNAAVSAMAVGWVATFSWLVLTSITEVFVAQYHGAGRKEWLGIPVWQMLWLALVSPLCFIPLAFWGGGLFYGYGPETSLQREYLWWMFLLAPSYPAYGALCGFFIGQGHTLIVVILALVANVMNGILDWILIFGVEGVVPSLGISGAAIATSVSIFFQVIVLGIVFLNRKNRREHGTGNWRFQPPFFWQALRVGFPSALFAVVEVGGWAAFYTIMTYRGENYITIAGICQSVMLLLYFFIEGLNKAVATLAGNFIGAKQSQLVSSTLRSGLKLNVSFCLFVGVLLFCFQDALIALFLPDAFFIEHEIRRSLSICLFCTIAGLFLETVRMMFTGALTAAGDTLFLFITGSLSIWLFMTIPVYWLILVKESSVEMASVCAIFYGIVISFIYWYRFRSGQWKNQTFAEEIKIAEP